jgi:hypothetical protein
MWNRNQIPSGKSGRCAGLAEVGAPRVTVDGSLRSKRSAESGRPSDILDLVMPSEALWSPPWSLSKIWNGLQWPYRIPEGCLDVRFFRGKSARPGGRRAASVVNVTYLFAAAPRPTRGQITEAIRRTAVGSLDEPAWPRAGAGAGGCCQPSPDRAVPGPIRGRVAGRRRDHRGSAEGLARREAGLVGPGVPAVSWHR